jgi:hypothetical protein
MERGRIDMPIPTDRGYVVVVEEDDGSKTVLITSNANGGHPTDIYAMHVRTSGLAVHDDVELRGNGPRRFTTQIAEVYVDDGGTVHVATVRGARRSEIPA